MKFEVPNFRQPGVLAAVALTLLISGGSRTALAQGGEDVGVAADAAVTEQVETAAAESPAPIEEAAEEPAEDPDASDPMAAEMPGVEVIEHLGESVRLDLPFVDENGQPVTLADYTSDNRPILLTLNYYRCPMLCTLVMNGAVDAMKQVSLNPGTDYQVVTLSVDPAETPSLARMKKNTYEKTADAPAKGPDGSPVASTLTADEIADGWAFLTGEQHNIEALAESVGFGYKWVESQKQYAHPAVLILLSPDGTITRYLYGIEFKPDTLRLSLVEASDGKVGSTLDRFLLTCFHFDPNAGDYTWHAMATMRLGGLLVVLTLCGAITVMLVREYRHRSLAGQETQGTLDDHG